MNTVTVIINDVEYNLRGKEDEKYLLDVAAYVDTKIKEISGTNKKLSTSSAAVLTAVNIADELFKCDLEIGDITKKKNSLEERHLTLKERLRELKIEIDETTKARTAEVESLKSTISQLEETVKEFEKIKSLNLKLSKKIDEITKSNNDLNAENNYLNAEIEKLTESKNQEIERLTESKNEEIEKLTKAKNEEIKTLTESKNQEIEKLTKAKNGEIKTLTEVKNQEIERLTKTNNEEIKILTESKNQEVEKLTESKNKLETKIKNLTEEINSKIEKEKFNEVLNKLQKTQKINIMLSDENDDLKEVSEFHFESLTLNVADKAGTQTFYQTVFDGKLPLDLQFEQGNGADLTVEPQKTWDLEILEFKVSKNYDLKALADDLEAKGQSIYLDKKESVLVLSDPSQVEIWFIK